MTPHVSMFLAVAFSTSLIAQANGPARHREGDLIDPSEFTTITQIAFRGKIVREGQRFVVTEWNRKRIRWLKEGFKFTEAEIITIGDSGVTIKWNNRKPEENPIEEIPYSKISPPSSKTD